MRFASLALLAVAGSACIHHVEPGLEPLSGASPRPPPRMMSREPTCW